MTLFNRPPCFDMRVRQAPALNQPLLLVTPSPPFSPSSPSPFPSLFPFSPSSFVLKNPQKAQKLPHKKPIQTHQIKNQMAARPTHFVRARTNHAPVPPMPGLLWMHYVPEPILVFLQTLNLFRTQGVRDPFSFHRILYPPCRSTPRWDLHPLRLFLVCSRIKPPVFSPLYSCFSMSQTSRSSNKPH